MSLWGDPQRQERSGRGESPLPSHDHGTRSTTSRKALRESAAAHRDSYAYGFFAVATNSAPLALATTPQPFRSAATVPKLSFTLWQPQQNGSGRLTQRFHDLDLPCSNALDPLRATILQAQK